MLIGLGPRLGVLPQDWGTYTGSLNTERTMLYDDIAWEGDNFVRSTPMGNGVFVLQNFRRATGSNPAGLVCWAIRVNADNSISFGAPVMVATTGFLNWSASVSVLKTEDNHCVVLWNKATTTFDIYARTLVVASDLSITMGSTVTVITGVTGTRMDHSHAVMLDATKLILAGRSDSTTFRVRAYGLTWNTTTKQINPTSTTSHYVGNSTMEQGARLIRLNNTQAIMASTGASPVGPRAVVLTWNGTSITTGTAASLTMTSPQWADNFNSNGPSESPGVMTYGMASATTGLYVTCFKASGTTISVGPGVTVPPTTGTGWNWNPVWISPTLVMGLVGGGSAVRAVIGTYDTATNKLVFSGNPVVVEPSGLAFITECHRIDAKRVLAIYGQNLGTQTTAVARILQID